VDGKRCEFSLHRSISENQWNPSKECLLGQSKLIKEQNSYLDFVKMKLMEHKFMLEEKGIKVSPVRLKKAFLGINEKERTLLEVFKEHNDRCKDLIGIDFAQGTYERYNTCYLHVKRFIQFRYHKKDIKLFDMSPSFVKDFEFYLKTERKCGHNTATKYLKNFKKITRIALNNGWMKSDPFKNIKFHLKEVDMDFLTSKELNTLIKK